MSPSRFKSSYKRNQIKHNTTHKQTFDQLKKQKQLVKIYQQTEQSIFYLNDSFKTNLQTQQILIQLKKNKGKNMKASYLQKIYKIFTQNRANQLIFQKLSQQYTKKIKQQQVKQLKLIRKSQLKLKKQPYKRNKNNSTLNTFRNSLKIQINQFQQSSTNPSSFQNNLNHITEQEEQQNQNNQSAQTRQIFSVLHRIYCRLIQKVITKVSFYTLNKKHLSFIGHSVLLTIKNLETILRRINKIKDIRLLQLMINKIYKENKIIEKEILKELVDKAYIMSLDQFFRVNGSDKYSKDNFQRKQKDQQIVVKVEDVKKQNKQQQHKRLIQKQKIQNLNNQITKQLSNCVEQIKKFTIKSQKKLKQQTKIQKKPEQLSLIPQSSLRKNSKTLRPSKFSQLNNSQTQQYELHPYIQIIPRKISLAQNNRSSIFSIQFVNMINNSPSQNRLSRNLSLINDKNVLKKLTQSLVRGNARISENSTLSRLSQYSHNTQDYQQDNDNQQINKQKIQKISLKSSKAVNKILGLYQQNPLGFNINDFLNQSLNISQEQRIKLETQLLKSKLFYKDQNQNENIQHFSIKKSKLINQNGNVLLQKIKKQKKQNKLNSSNKHEQNKNIIISKVSNLTKYHDKQTSKNIFKRHSDVQILQATINMLINNKTLNYNQVSNFNNFQNNKSKKLQLSLLVTKTSNLQQEVTKTPKKLLQLPKASKTIHQNPSHLNKTKDIKSQDSTKKSKTFHNNQFVIKIKPQKTSRSKYQLINTNTNKVKTQNFLQQKQKQRKKYQIDLTSRTLKKQINKFTQRKQSNQNKKKQKNSLSFTNDKMKNSSYDVQLLLGKNNKQNDMRKYFTNLMIKKNYDQKSNYYYSIDNNNLQKQWDIEENIRTKKLKKLLRLHLKENKENINISINKDSLNITEDYISSSYNNTVRNQFIALTPSFLQNLQKSQQKSIDINSKRKYEKNQKSLLSPTKSTKQQNFPTDNIKYQVFDPKRRLKIFHK